MFIFFCTFSLVLKYDFPVDTERMIVKYEKFKEISASTVLKKYVRRINLCLQNKSDHYS